MAALYCRIVFCLALLISIGSCRADGDGLTMGEDYGCTAVGKCYTVCDCSAHAEAPAFKWTSPVKSLKNFVVHKVWQPVANMLPSFSIFPERKCFCYTGQGCKKDQECDHSKACTSKCHKQSLLSSGIGSIKSAIKGKAKDEI